MTEYIRILNEQGLEKFQNYINQLKDGMDEDPPVDELSQEPFSVEFSPRIKVGKRTFANRLEMGKYLSEILQGISADKLTSEKGLWSWLALFWFDIICPRDDNGMRKILKSNHYICSSNWKYWHRHFIAASWDIYSTHKRFSRLFLGSPIFIHNDWTEQVASRQDFISNKYIVEAIDKLYWDESKEKPKPKALGPKVGGGLRRLIQLIQQFGRTYDLFSIPPKEFLSLLPQEFNNWKK
ncbi:MAG: hypothetical protein QME51_02140 [Planctomycetota bacterium]|nr:hypothetical protein [Planctomycetota bacterium]MDI6787153.1 hypothetical protein [Planctomycetota bacterium]